MLIDNRKQVFETKKQAIELLPVGFYTLEQINEMTGLQNQWIGRLTIKSPNWIVTRNTDHSVTYEKIK